MPDLLPDPAPTSADYAGIPTAEEAQAEMEAATWVVTYHQRGLATTNPANPVRVDSAPEALRLARRWADQGPRYYSAIVTPRKMVSVIEYHPETAE